MKKNIIYVLFTFCFIFFAGNWALGQNQGNNTELVIVQVGENGSPGYTTCTNVRSVNFRSANYISCIRNGDYIPGDNIPEVGLLHEMYIIAYINNDINDVIGQQKLHFYNDPSNTDEIIISEEVSISLNNLGNYSYGCSPHPSGSSEVGVHFKITLAYFDDAGIHRYYDNPIHSQWLWPGDIALDAPYILEADRLVCCGNGGQAQPGPGGNNPLVEDDNVNTLTRAKSSSNNESDRETVNFPTTSKRKCIVSIFPNPVGNLLTIHLSFEQASKVEIRILKKDGRLVRYFNKDFNRGENNLQIYMNELLSGIYILNIITPFENRSIKLIKM